MRRMIIGLVPAILLLLLVPGAASAATTRIVDDNLACPGATFTTIQAAVNTAIAGDTVKVCAGSYVETVTVNKTLTIQGAQMGVDARTRVAVAGTESVVAGPGGGFNVSANNVSINGFTIKNAAGSTGITLNTGFNGSKVTNNIIKNNTIGIYANSSGAGQTKVSNNRLFDNNADGPAAGNGIYSDQGLTGGRINDNLFERNSNAGVLIALNAATVNDLKIMTNSGVDNGSFVAVFHGTNVQVDQNTTGDTVPGDDNSQGSAIFVGGDAAGVSVSTNVVKDSPFNGIAVRATASAVTVQSNTIRRASANGISVSSSTSGGVSVLSNSVKFSQTDGISLEDTTSNDTVTGNTSVNNDLSSTGSVDCRDATLGSGTSGTANTWTSNTGNTSSPPGLCT